MTAYSLIRPVLYQFDAESLHNRTLDVLGAVSRSESLCAAVRRSFEYDDPRLSGRVFGATFSSPLGVAAGLDKNGIAVPALLALGFSFVEIGAVTPVAQPGNPKPRVFRLPEDRALINRMGFPGAGVDEVECNLQRYSGRLGNLGCNIGPNKTSLEAGEADEDCVAVFRRLQNLATYVVVNVSSPNTTGLRALQGKDALRELLSRVIAARSETAKRTPVLVKIAPDMSDRELDDVLDVADQLRLDGIVATNTTVSRPTSLRSVNRIERGGLSGAPLRERSRDVVRRIAEQTGGKLPIIATGGIFSGGDVIDAIAAGASLVQLYTGFIYRGPSTAREIKREMSQALDRLQVASLDDIRGQQVTTNSGSRR